MTKTKATPALDPARTDFYRTLLEEMLRIRRFEERAAEAYALGQIGGFCHLYIGQEAIAVAAAEVLAEHDGVPVLVRHETCTVAAFHPELTNDTRLHELFVSRI